MASGLTLAAERAAEARAYVRGLRVQLEHARTGAGRDALTSALAIAEARQDRAELDYELIALDGLLAGEPAEAAA